jgi:hypothetical protein
MATLRDLLDVYVALCWRECLLFQSLVGNQSLLHNFLIPIEPNHSEP